MDISFNREIRVPVGNPKLAKIDIDKFLIIRPGDQAPEFAATTTDGKTIKLSELEGKVVLIDFWATWCGPCVAELPNMKKAYTEFAKNDDFVVIGISLDEHAKTVQKFIKKTKLPWPQIVVGPAEKSPIAKKYNVSAVPATFLLDRKGKVVATDLRGGRLQAELRKLLPAEKIAADTKTDGAD